MAKKTKKKPAAEKLDPRIEKVYEEEIEFDCPVRGRVKQKVKIKRYKPPTSGTVEEPVGSETGSKVLDKIEEKEESRGLSIYTAEELDTSGTEEK